MATYLLHALNLTAAEASPLLFLTHCSEDFTGDSLLHGLQTVLGPSSVGWRRESNRALQSTPLRTLQFTVPAGPGLQPGRRPPPPARSPPPPTRAVDVSSDTDGFRHPWCADAHRDAVRKPSLRAHSDSTDQGPALPGHAAASAHVGSPRAEGPTRFSLSGRHATASASGPPPSRASLPSLVRAREYGLVVFGSASRTVGGLFDAVSAAYPRVRRSWDRTRVSAHYPP